MNIKETKSRFKNNEISKVDFIAEMHEFHKVLFDFSNNLVGNEIAKIEIEDGNVVFVSRQTEKYPGNVKFFINVIDKYTTPVTAFNFGQYEKEDSEMLYNLINDGDTVFDIGANIGWYSYHLAKKFPEAKIYAFEPIPETFSQFKRNAELNQSKNVFLNNLAFSDKKGKLTFFYSPVISGASSSVNITEDDSMVTLECEADTIDHFMQEQQITNLDFIKCDVEGAELFVYKGAINTLKKQKPVVFTEMLRKWSAKFNYHPNDIITLFKQLGYNCYVVTNSKLGLIEEVTDSTIETNYFFLHSEKHLEKIKSFT